MPDILQRQEKDRPLPLLRHIPFASPFNSQAAKEFPVILFPVSSKKIIEHGQEQCLAKTAWPRQQQYFPMIIEEIPYSQGLIDKIIIFLTDFGKIVNTNRQALHRRSPFPDVKKIPLHYVYSIRESPVKRKAQSSSSSTMTLRMLALVSMMRLRERSYFRTARAEMMSPAMPPTTAPAVWPMMR